MARGEHNDNSKCNGATLGFKATLWTTAERLRNNMDAGEYKHVFLGLIFLKYVSDVFEVWHGQVRIELDPGADLDEYRSKNIFWVPKEARRSFFRANAIIGIIGLDVKEDCSNGILGRVYEYVYEYFLSPSIRVEGKGAGRMFPSEHVFQRFRFHFSYRSRINE